MDKRAVFTDKGKTAEGIAYCSNQEKYMRVFLENGDVPMDNSASERALRPFCIGRKNWLFCNTERGAQASANIYSISETAKLNNLRPLKYFEYILTQLPYRCDDKGKIDPDKIEDLMPWSDKIPEDCRKKQ
ncbi:MAG: transposase [Firmicutes bacterium]|nr:transposase [Bacillota bacterium]